MLDVLQSQDEYAQARLRYAETVVHYNISQVDLLASLGLIDKDRLIPLVIELGTGVTRVFSKKELSGSG